MTELFPKDPTDGMLFELQTGLVYQYEAHINSWVRIISNNVLLPLATYAKAGAMSHLDLHKLNRLVLPPPKSSIIGTDCIVPYRHGTIQLYSGDQYVQITGSPTLQNLDQFGSKISQDIPFHIHQHTFGHDFTLNSRQLFDDLIAAKQIHVVGAAGDKGPKGHRGDPGRDMVLAGPRGHKGQQGKSAPCAVTLEVDTIQTTPQPGPKRVLTDAQVVVHRDDPTLYSLMLTRQPVGVSQPSTGAFLVKQQKSSWVLAVPTIAATPQPLQYLDLDPVVEAIHQKYLKEVQLLKTGYEQVVKYWLQFMSDLFDEQKAALCCALEFCTSKTKSTQLRQHMESVAAAASGTASIRLHGRNSTGAVEIGSTRLLAVDGESKDTCKFGPPFPQLPNSHIPLPEPPPPLRPPPPWFPAPPAPPLIPTPPVPPPAPPPPVVPLAIPTPPVSAQAVVQTLEVDPQIHVGTSANGVTADLAAGEYVATIKHCTAQIGGLHQAGIKLQVVEDGKKRLLQFLDKGKFESGPEARRAYEGLSLGFKHDGGPVRAYFPILPTTQAAGLLTVAITPSAPRQAQIALEPALPVPVAVEQTPEPIKIQTADTCSMAPAHLEWYSKGWQNDRCCGVVMRLAGQDFIIFKRSLGNDLACGGGESLDTACIAAFIDKYGHPAFAWPTLDGKTFAPIPDSDIVFKLDAALNDLFLAGLQDESFTGAKGSPSGSRHLAYQLTTVLFPVV